MNGFFLVNKEKGISSNKVVQEIKHKFNFNKVGHLGTLDPMATGLLIIAINKATKFSSYFLNETKGYKAEITLGSTSNTDDAEGEIIEVTNVLPNHLEIEKVLNSYLGKSLQNPPFFSALKHKGKPLYKYARQGKLISKPPREINIFTIDNTRYEEPKITFNILCSKGTYIRAIARDLGEDLNCGGLLSALKRTQQGCFDLTDANNIKNLSTEHMISIENAFPNFNSIKLSEMQTKLYMNGGIVENIKANEEVAKVYSHEDKFIGLGLVNELGLKLKQLV